MLIKIIYTNCEDGEGAVELFCHLGGQANRDRITRILKRFMRENPFHTDASNFIVELSTHGIVASEVKYDLEVVA